MKRYLAFLSLLVTFVLGACNGGETDQRADTTSVPGAIDTMPVLHPGMFDSGNTIKTPPTGDDNVILPDSAIQ